MVVVAKKSKGVICSDKPPMLPRNGEFRRHCEDKSNWPCFQYNRNGLHGANIFAIVDGKAVADDSVLQAQDADLTSHNISYYTHDKDCYFMYLEKWDNEEKYYLEVASKDGSWVTTWQHRQISVRVCTKWASIGVHDVN
ncbi:related to Mig1 protein [Sporisorium scitamineum]|uniref:Related to Mig1 protein n=1 Tax=Sporisorium scitamineum TaxID=49012 RepID=A0A127Z430_9BASI|nr:related to Mig1 protein [Sporisorium scitamineum]